MLVVTRRTNTKLMIGDNIVITIVDIKGGKVRIGIEAPKDVTIHRDDYEQGGPKKPT